MVWLTALLMFFLILRRRALWAQSCANPRAHMADLPDSDYCPAVVAAVFPVPCESGESRPPRTGERIPAARPTIPSLACSAAEYLPQTSANFSAPGKSGNRLKAWSYIPRNFPECRQSLGETSLKVSTC